MQPCYCQSTVPFEQCCAPLLQGQTPAVTPGALMRSRYSAYRLGLGEYLYRSWHPETRTELTPELLAESGLNTEWLGLDVIYSRGGPDDQEGEVEFKVRYKELGRIQLLHERSLFLRVQGHWMYHSGRFNPPKIGKNAPCPCGSPKKYKQCCALRRT